MSKDYSQYGLSKVMNNRDINEQGMISIVTYLSCLYATQWNVQDIVGIARSRVWDESHNRIRTQNNPGIRGNYMRSRN